MCSAASAQPETISVESDDTLLAEIAPAMLAKLKADSRQHGVSVGFLLTFAGGFLIPNLVKQFGAPGSTGLPPGQLGDWIGPLAALFAIASLICGAVVVVHAFIGQPAQLRTEVSYRRQHGKWRWDR